MRVVIDTQLLLRASTNTHSLSYKLVYSTQDLVQFVNSLETLAEVQDVLSRLSLRRKFPILSDEICDSLLEHLRLHGMMVTLADPIPAVSRDPKDDIFLATAQAGNADYLVTQDNDLLVIGQYGATRIVDLPTFWQVLEEIQ